MCVVRRVACVRVRRVVSDRPRGRQRPLRSVRRATSALLQESCSRDDVWVELLETDFRRLPSDVSVWLAPAGLAVLTGVGMPSVT
jgi:hypothetical protein